ncbi:MAG: LysM peptidoglycan-binding domain-containing protein [Gammaproteobacteria bacterium]
MENRRYRGLKRAGSGEKYLYTVRRGDTLWDIGRHYGVSIRNLCAWNGISSRRYLRPGQKLTLWLAENGDAAPNHTKTRVAQGNTQTNDDGTINYTVQSGDSLWLIARRFGVTTHDLVAWNNISPRHYLRPGQKLTLQPAENGDAAPDHTTTRVAQNDTQANDHGTINYTVQNGDSLWLIARRFDVTVHDLVAWNGISPRHYLRPGQELTLQPAAKDDSVGGDDGSMVDVSDQVNDDGVINYTVKRGDSLWLISRRFGVTVAQLVKWNNLSRDSFLQPGQELILRNAPASSSGA